MFREGSKIRLAPVKEDELLDSLMWTQTFFKENGITKGHPLFTLSLAAGRFYILTSGAKDRDVEDGGDFTEALKVVLGGYTHSNGFCLESSIAEVKEDKNVIQ